MTTEERNMELMQTLDDAWNAQDWDRSDAGHKTNSENGCEIVANEPDRS